MAKTITVFSNKGGVGKTFVAVNMAAALALKGQRVLIVDMDFQAGQDMARMLNLAPKNSLVDLLSQGESESEPTIIKKFVMSHSSGLDFLPAVTHMRQVGHITPDNIKPFFKKASAIYDFIIVDAGNSFSETMITVLDQSNLILVVATPDILAVYQMKYCIELLQSLHYPLKMIKLVLNRAESRGGVAWQEVKEALTLDIFSLVPSDGKTVGMALNRGIPCVIDSPKTRVSEVFMEMADNLRREELYVHSTEVVRVRSTEGTKKQDSFWNKFGVQEGASGAIAGSFKAEEDEVVKLKKNIHQKLVDRMDIRKITPEALADPNQAQKIKKTAENIVVELITEMAGMMISSHEERSRIVKEIVNEALGLGPLEEFLADPDVADIMVNNKDEIFVEKNGKIILTNKKFISNEQVRATIDRIIAPLGRRIDESTPMVDARLSDGSRINAIIPPLSLGGPMITIRKFAQERFTVEDLLTRFDTLNQAMADFLNACVIGRKNMIVSGGTGAGKTTLLNIISQFIPDNERIITLEDAAELRLVKSHWARLETRPPNIEGKGRITIRDLFVNTLRMRPDRIIIGECRGAEVLDMLQAMNTGHDGSLTTLHANSTRDVISRMSSMVLLSGIELPLRAIYEMVASAINIIVHVSRFSDGTRKITGVAEVTGKLIDGLPEMEEIFVFKHKGINADGKVIGDYVPTGYVPKVFADLVMRGMKLNKSMFEPPAL